MKSLKILSISLLSLLFVGLSKLQARLGDFVGDVVGGTINTAVDVAEAPLDAAAGPYYNDGYYDGDGFYHRRHYRDGYYRDSREYRRPYYHYDSDGRYYTK